MTRSASDDANPYRGAPYIGFLKAHLASAPIRRRGDREARMAGFLLWQKRRSRVPVAHLVH
jgi:hypothetical protein